MKFWIDADAAPGDAKTIVFRAAKRLNFPVVMVANSMLSTPPGQTWLTSIVVANHANAADDYLVENAAADDVVMTADIPLAARLAEKSVAVISPRGEELTPDKVGGYLAMRNLMEGFRQAGETTGGPAPYSAKDAQRFANALDQMLTRKLRKRPGDARG